MSQYKLAFLSLPATVALFCAQVWAAPLPAFNADPGQITVSGVSSGAAMAVQAHVAYSGTFKGAAVFAGPAYYCAQNSLATATTRCMETLSSLQVPVAELVTLTRSWASQGLIDNTVNLANSKVYLFSGTLDQTVRQPSVDALRDYYANFVNPANIVYNNTTAAGHGWISPMGPVACAASQSPYINNCSIDTAQSFLSQFYGPLQPRQSGQLSGQFIAFEQGDFLDDRNPGRHGLDSYGWLFVPASCARGELCRVHVAYHGCNMSYSKIGEQFIRLSGLNEWADTNRLIVVYPQVSPSLAEPVVNGQGCWDWWGYDSQNYAQKSGPQLAMTKRIVDRITSGYAPVAAPTYLVAANISGTSVRLTWNPVSGAAGYRLYRNGVPLTSNAISKPEYVDSALSRNTSYTYTVRAVAPNGNLGPASEALTVSTR